MSRNQLHRHKSGREGELDDLQKKFRDLEAKFKIKHSSGDNPESTIRMHRQQIDKLKKDNDRLKEDLALETRQAKQANDMSASAQIAKLQDQADHYTRKIKQEKAKIRQLDSEIIKVQEAISAKKAKMAQSNTDNKNKKKTTSQSIQQEIRKLENKLDNALVKFNESIAGNKKLRAQIDNLRRDRKNFTEIYKRLHKELEDKQKKMTEIIQTANAAADARDAAQAQMIQLKAQADKEQKEFEEEWRQLGRLIEQDRNVKDIVQDGPARIDSEDRDPARDEKKLKRRVSEGSWGIQNNRQNILDSMEKVQNYEEAFAKIQKATAITDIDELVMTFIDAEDANFSLFNYVNDLSSQIDTYQENIDQVNQEIEKYRGKGMDGDNKRKGILKDLEAQLVKTESKSQHYEQNYQEAMDAVNALKDGIQRVFVKIGCKDSGLLGNAGVTESNMMQYLGLIEERANELLGIYEEQQRVEGQSNPVSAPEPEVAAAEEPEAEAAPAAAEGAEAAPEPAAEAAPAAEEGVPAADPA